MSVWREACSPGQPPKFTSPDQMWERATEYFAWVEDNPFLEERLAQSNAGGRHASLRNEPTGFESLLTELEEVNEFGSRDSE